MLGSKGRQSKRAGLLMVRILVVDDRPEIRTSVREYVETQPGWEVCGEAADGEQAVEAASTLRPSIVILDVHLPGITGFDAARQILKTSPDIPILIPSIHGARGFLNKCNADELLVPAISRLLLGEVYFPQLATVESSRDSLIKKLK
jgi:DNA-binding NarL/FixJ family response regulator